MTQEYKGPVILLPLSLGMAKALENFLMAGGFGGSAAPEIDGDDAEGILDDARLHDLRKTLSYCLSDIENPSDNTDELLFRLEDEVEVSQLRLERARARAEARGSEDAVSNALVKNRENELKENQGNLLAFISGTVAAERLPPFLRDNILVIRRALREFLEQRRKTYDALTRAPASNEADRALRLELSDDLNAASPLAKALGAED